MNPPPGKLRTVFEWIAGILLILVGIIGGFVPVLQGWIFIVAGLAILSRHNRFARRLYDRFKHYGRKVKDRVRRKRPEDDIEALAKGQPDDLPKGQIGVQSGDQPGDQPKDQD